MSISTEQAEKMVDEKMAREAAASKAAEQPTEVKEPSTPDPKPEEPKKDEPPKEEPPKEEPKKEEPPKEEKPEEKPEEKDAKDKLEEGKEKKLPPSKKYTKDQRIAHSFAIEKKKRQAAQARVKELEAELDKIKGLKPADFGDDVEAYTSYRIEEAKKRDELERKQEFIKQSEADEQQLETERRVSMCFPDAAEREEYDNLIASRGRAFYDALQEHDPNGVVLDYLNGVEEYPKVLRELMTNSRSLAYVFRDKDPWELRHNLHVFTKEFLAGKQAVPEEKKEPEQQPEPPKPKIPVIGKQVTVQAKPTEPVHDRAYWNEYLRKHPNG